ncbi:MAG TPA: rhombotarget lipoprotein [Thermoanaerobaculia bacterium]
MRLRTLPPLLVAAALLAAACGGSYSTRRASSALDFLYPGGAGSGEPAQSVTLKLPVRVGIAFAPAGDGYAQYGADPVPESLKQDLLEKVAAAFRSHEGIGRIEVVPSHYLKPGGGFTNLGQLASTLGLDLAVLVSYDQVQITESSRASWTYLTVVGPLLIEGEKNDTRTVMDAIVYDIPSHALLFRAAGDSKVNERSSPLNEARTRRRMAEEGFAKATTDLITNLDTALAGFEEQAKSGTVRGAGTPAIAMYDKSGKQIGGGGTNGGGAGALGAGALAAVALLAGAALAGRRRR